VTRSGAPQGGAFAAAAQSNHGENTPTGQEPQGSDLLFRWQRSLRDSDLPPVTRHVALALSTYMNIEGGSAFPGARNLAHDTGLHERTVRRGLNELVEGEWLAVVERGGLPGEERRANRYQAVIPNPWRQATGGVRPGVPLASDTSTPGVRPSQQPIEQPIEQPTREEEKPKRKPDPIFDALCDETNTNPKELTRSSRGSLNKATKELRNLGADAGNITRRADQYRRRYPTATLTPSALVKHWPTLGDAAQPESSNGDTPAPAFGPYECPLGLGCDNGNIWDAQKNGSVRCECIKRKFARVAAAEAATR
jgi:Helix-turn-helix domain